MIASTARSCATAAVATIVILLAWSLAGGARLDDQGLARRLDRLEERIRALESAVGMSERPAAKASLAERVRTLEQGLRRLSEASGRPAWSSAASNLRELERSTRDAQRQQAECTRQVEDVRRQLRSILQRLDETRDIRSRLGRLDQALDSLEARVRRLESRR